MFNNIRFIHIFMKMCKTNIFLNQFCHSVEISKQYKFRFLQNDKIEFKLKNT